MLDSLITTLLRGEGPTSGLTLLALGLFISLLLRVLVAPGHRTRLRTPTLLLITGASLMIALEYVGPLPKLLRWITVAPVVLLLLAFGQLLSVGLFDWLLARRLQRDAPRIVRDIVDGLFTVVALLVTLGAMGVEAGSLLTTSALLTAVLGLSLQDTLGNVFSGLSLQMQRPFGVGDWIQIDREGMQIGRVVEINWRATRLITEKSQELTIPNSQLARAVILNHSRPLDGTQRTVRVTLPYELPTQRAHAILRNALDGVQGVISSPKPRIDTEGFVDHGIRYELCFYISDFGQRLVIEATVRDRIWYALSRARLMFATAPRGASLQGIVSEIEERDARTRALRRIDFLRDLPDSAIETLSAAAGTALYAPGEYVVRQGETGEELYLCLRGELVVLHALDTGEQREITRLREGGLFGEFAQMTGETRAATVQAATACELVVVPKVAFAQVLSANPAFAELISQRLAERRAELEVVDLATTASQRPSVDEHKGQFLRRLREFFLT